MSPLLPIGVPVIVYLCPVIDSDRHSEKGAKSSSRTLFPRSEWRFRPL
jgi:hypothetical protein